MSKPVFYTVLFISLFAPLRSFAQTNLIYNGGFEEYYSCPGENDLNNGEFEKCKGWWKPTLGTSDYYNRCNTNGVLDVPNNFWGYQESYAGDAYVGLGAIEWNFSTGNIVGGEYIQTNEETKDGK